MSCQPSTIYMIGPNRSRLAKLTQLIQRAGDEAIFVPDMATYSDASRVRPPDCILLDMTPSAAAGDGGEDPPSMLHELIHSNPLMPVVCLSADNSLRRAVQAMRQGAFDYLPISCTSLELKTALDEARDFSHSKRQQAAQRIDTLSRYEHLTGREKQIFALIVSGLPNKEIVETLDLSLQTVKIHRARVLAKMGATSILDLYRHAETLGHTNTRTDITQREPSTKADLYNKNA